MFSDLECSLVMNTQTARRALTSSANCRTCGSLVAHSHVAKVLLSTTYMVPLWVFRDIPRSFNLLTTSKTSETCSTVAMSCPFFNPVRKGHENRNQNGVEMVMSDCHDCGRNSRSCICFGRNRDEDRLERERKSPSVEFSKVYEVYQTDSGGRRDGPSRYVRSRPADMDYFTGYSVIPSVIINGRTFLLRQVEPVQCD